MPTPLLSQILEHNQAFVSQRRYEPMVTNSPPNKRLVVVTCMDSRLLELLPAAMNLHNGDAKILKTGGAIISHPFGSITRSILVAVYDLGAKEIAIVGHKDCGMTGLSWEKIQGEVKKRGISEQTIQTLEHAGVSLRDWMIGFDHVEDAVRKSVDVVKNHPLLPADVLVDGLIIDPKTGQLEVVVDAAPNG